MVIGNGILLAFDLNQNSSGDPPDWWWESEAPGIMKYLASGRCVGWSRAVVRKEQLPALFGEPITRAHLYSDELLRNQVRMVAVELSKEQTKRSLDSTSWELVDAMLETVFEIRPERVWPRGRTPSYGRLLLLPVHDIDLDEIKDSEGSVLREDLTEMGLAQSVAAPSLLNDVIVLPGFSPGRFSEDVTVVWPVPPLSPIREDAVPLPETAWNLWHYLLTIHLIDASTRLLKAHKLSQLSASEYLGGLRTESHGGLPREIVDRRLIEREQLLIDLLDSESAVKSIQYEGEWANARQIETAPRTVLWRAIDSEFSYDMIETIFEERAQAVREYFRTREQLRVREDSIANYLRDRLAADLAHSNLRLQRSIRWLTLMAVIVGTAVALLPESAKVVMWRLLSRGSVSTSDTSPLDVHDSDPITDP